MQVDIASSSVIHSTGKVPGRPRVLIADDNEEMLTRTAACLARDFVVVGTVKDGRAALEAAGTLQPDVIVLDVSMPRMTGIEVAARLKAAGSKTAVVFLTVHSEEDVVQAARDAGGVGYVYKPRFASELLVAAREASTGHRFLSANIPRHLW